MVICNMSDDYKINSFESDLIAFNPGGNMIPTSPDK
jgi:hypothetical protein